MEKEIVELIKNQIGSNGDKGWPVAVRDRIAFPNSKELRVTDANFGVTFLWTMRDDVLPYLEKENLAIATNFYTPAGLEGMIRNILGNPFIRYVILLGEEYSSKKGGDGAELTSANAIRTFFEKGVGEDRKLEGFENSVYFDKNIPLDLINAVKENVELIDLNKRMFGATMQEKIAEANRIIKSSFKKEFFLENPYVFDYEESSDSFPYEGGPLIVHGGTIPNAWVKMISNVYRYGKKNLMNADTDRWVKEINNMAVVIHHPQNTDLSINPFLVPLTEEKIEAYKKEILSPLLPEGKAYTYGNKLRAYYFPSKEIKDLVSSEEYKDFEFGKGDWIDANVSYDENSCEIDQLQDMIDVLKRDPYSKAVVALTWHPADELMRKHKSSPCLIFLQAIVQDEKLNLTVFFRSHDMAQGWPENAYGAAALQNEVAKGLGIGSGVLTIISGSAQIYNNYYQQVEEMLKKYKEELKSCHDARGNYLIELKDGEIVVGLVHPETGKELEQFRGKTAYELKDKIEDTTLLSTGHAIYLGTELLLAELALRENKLYVQDRSYEEINLGKISKETGRPNWEEFFMFHTLLSATRSSCHHLHTGAAIVKDQRVIAIGYNGAPPEIENCLDRGCRKTRQNVEFEEKGKGVCRGIHAEVNALAQISRQNLKGTKLYTVYLPCSACAKHIAGSGIKKVIYLKKYKEEDSLTKEIFAEAGISLKKMDLDVDKILGMIKSI